MPRPKKSPNDTPKAQMNSCSTSPSPPSMSSSTGLATETDSRPSNVPAWSNDIPDCPMPVPRDSPVYNMSNKSRGYAIIFNYIEVNGFSPRLGSERDAQRLKSLYSSLGFKVEEYKDLTASQTSHEIQRLSETDYSDCDCLIVTVLSHGSSGGYIYTKDFSIDIDQFWQPFRANLCRSLAGKPKIFIIQACRGGRKDKGVRLVKGETQMDAQPRGSSYRLPSAADFFFAYSTTEGDVSFRETDNGSWFIQCFCETFIEYHKTLDLQKMFTIVSRRVAIDFVSTSHILDDDSLKQVPQICSTLIRDVFFK